MPQDERSPGRPSSPAGHADRGGAGYGGVRLPGIFVDRRRGPSHDGRVARAVAGGAAGANASTNSRAESGHLLV